VTLPVGGFVWEHLSLAQVSCFSIYSKLIGGPNFQGDGSGSTSSRKEVAFFINELLYATPLFRGYNPLGEVP